jgi:hypothetical protein
MTADPKNLQIIRRLMTQNHKRLLHALSGVDLWRYAAFMDEGLSDDERIAAFERLGASNPAGRQMALLWKFIAGLHHPELLKY